jgi:Holliday junction DNA helicase, RuvA subunit
MIDYLKGTVVFIRDDYIVVDVGGVGYRVYCANPYVFQDKKDEQTVVYTHYHVREDAHQLYGFATREEQELFRKLLEVNGIGPKVAAGMLAGGRPEDVVSAIRREDVAWLTKLPGIGRKTAQRIVLDLKDKLDGVAVAVPFASGEAVRAASSSPDAPPAWAEAREALMALGYSEAELDRAWAGIRKRIEDGETVDSLMKRAFKWLFHG